MGSELLSQPPRWTKPLRAEVPHLQASDWYRSMVCQARGCPAGGEQSFFPLCWQPLPVTDIMAWARCLLEQPWHSILTGARTLILKSRRTIWDGHKIKCTIKVIHLNHPQTILPPVHGKTVFHKTDPWCQKNWGPLTQRATSRSPMLFQNPGRKSFRALSARKCKSSRAFGFWGWDRTSHPGSCKEV